MKRWFSAAMGWLPDDPRQRAVVIALLCFIAAERLILVLSRPDLLHDLDAGELKHMDLALYGLQHGEGWKEKLLVWLAGPENVHHGGYPMVSVAFLLLSKVLGPSLTVLRLLPIGATVLAAACTAVWLNRRAGGLAAVGALIVIAGAPPLFLKWTCVSRGGHLEGILFAPVLLLLFESGIRGPRKRTWLLAGALGGFAVYFTYLAAPLVGLLAIGALIERRSNGGVLARGGLLALGAVIGFLPWIFGLLVLDMPYLEATIHQSGNPDEAAQVFSRGMLGTIRAALSSLPHNLWPWTITRTDAPAYLSNASDMLDFTPTAREWTVRGVMIAAATLGIVAAFARRSALLVAVTLLPAVHYVFTVRMANPLAWPDVPHRYLVLVFPMTAASIGLGLHWLASGTGTTRKRLGMVAAGIVAIVGLHGAVLHIGWLGAPDLSAVAAWDAGAYRTAGLGQVRLSEGAGMNDLLSRHGGEWENDAFRGLARVYPPNADYYLLFRGDSADARPYSGGLLAEPEPRSSQEEGRRALVRAIYDATLLRSGGDEERLTDWVCSWDPGYAFRNLVEELLAAEQPDLRCR